MFNFGVFSNLARSSRVKQTVIFSTNTFARVEFDCVFIFQLVMRLYTTSTRVLTSVTSLIAPFNYHGSSSN